MLTIKQDNNISIIKFDSLLEFQQYLDKSIYKLDLLNNAFLFKAFFYFGILKDDYLIGAASIKIDRPYLEYIEIKHFLIADGFIRTGLGTKLYNSIIQYFKPKFIILEPLDDEAELFWKSFGFTDLLDSDPHMLIKEHQLSINESNDFNGDYDKTIFSKYLSDCINDDNFLEYVGIFNKLQLIDGYCKEYIEYVFNDSPDYILQIIKQHDIRCKYIQTRNGYDYHFIIYWPEYKLYFDAYNNKGVLHLSDLLFCKKFNKSYIKSELDGAKELDIPEYGNKLSESQLQNTIIDCTKDVYNRELIKYSDLSFVKSKYQV